MTTVDCRDNEDNLVVYNEVFKIVRPTNIDSGIMHKTKEAEFTLARAGEFPQDALTNRENSIIHKLENKGYEILSVKSELISKRRYKRRLAKENKRRAKYLVK